ncbi:hypothetical protein MOB09_07090 [Bacillus vallismortis]|uniref:hypothetical protein n=1 Tax=Bacillus vallismortis TaxID=72361 RepID=UPI002282CDAF|nr:hypothetical protein [Bacillus vallismortis]MCY7892786.1 hypothetical protein [Bacillus vallismortis]
MKNKKRLSLPFLCTVLSVAFSFCLTSHAAAQSVPKEKAIMKQQETLKNHKEMKDVSLKQADAGSLKMDRHEETMKVKKPANENVFKTASMYNSEDQVFDTSSVLNESNPDDMYFFSTSSDRTLITRILSANSQYHLTLYVVNWDTGEAQPTTIEMDAGNLVLLKELPAGDYMIRVYSEGTLGDSYHIQLNAKNPANYTSVQSITSNLQTFVAEYADGSVYANGTLLYNTGTKTSSLSWEREYYFSHGGGYNQRTHSISDVKVKSVSAPVTYHSSYASSNSAVMVYLDTGTLFMHHVSAYQSGGGYEDSFFDTLGKKTPRRLDADDQTYGDHILIVDTKTGKAIDFFSVLNYYYASGVESLPVISYIQ